jgi:hypothetical protein
MSIISTQHTKGQMGRVLSAVPGLSFSQHERYNFTIIADGPSNWADSVLLVHRVKTS